MKAKAKLNSKPNSKLRRFLDEGYLVWLIMVVGCIGALLLYVATAFDSTPIFILGIILLLPAAAFISFLFAFPLEAV